MTTTMTTKSTPTTKKIEIKEGSIQKKKENKKG
jgi:hypothetical protein